MFLRCETARNILSVTLAAAFILFLINLPSVHADFRLIELGYDDGKANGGVSDLANKTYGWGVLFTHPEPGEPYHIVGVKIYIFDVRGTGGLLRIFIYDYEPTLGKYIRRFETIIGGFSKKWNLIDLKNYRIIVKQNFIVGVNWAKNYILYLGDDHDTHCHSGGFNATKTTDFEHFEERNFMIRAVVRKSVAAKITVTPKELNLKDKGKWIAAHINLPENYDLGSVVLNTIRINNTVQVEPYPSRYNEKNDAYELMVQFDRTAIKGLIESKSLKIKVTLELTGEFVNGVLFYGVCDVKLIS